MFGPNVHFERTLRIHYSHRDARFFRLYDDLSRTFSAVFGLDDYDILFIPGSGTVGIESVMYSVLRKINVIGATGTFRARWERMARQYSSQKKGPPIDLFAQLETSRSAYFEKEGCLVDGVSAFPYYDLPKDTKALVTCSNKVLGSFVGLAIVAVKKDFWQHMLSEQVFSYLNLSRYREYARLHQTPSTTPSYVFEHLLEVLREFDRESLRTRINTISDRIVEEVGESNILGQTRCPVITIKKKAIPRFLAEKFDLYGTWTGKPSYQVFTYSCSDQDYDRFLLELKRAKIEHTGGK